MPRAMCCHGYWMELQSHCTCSHWCTSWGVSEFTQVYCIRYGKYWVGFYSYMWGLSVCVHVYYIVGVAAPPTQNTPPRRSPITACMRVHQHEEVSANLPTKTCSVMIRCVSMLSVSSLNCMNLTPFGKGFWPQYVCILLYLDPCTCRRQAARQCRDSVVFCMLNVLVHVCVCLHLLKQDMHMSIIIFPALQYDSSLEHLMRFMIISTQL